VRFFFEIDVWLVIGAFRKAQGEVGVPKRTGIATSKDVSSELLPTAVKYAPTALMHLLTCLPLNVHQTPSKSLQEEEIIAAGAVF